MEYSVGIFCGLENGKDQQTGIIYGEDKKKYFITEENIWPLSGFYSEFKEWKSNELANPHNDNRLAYIANEPYEEYVDGFTDWDKAVEGKQPVPEEEYNAYIQCKLCVCYAKEIEDAADIIREKTKVIREEGRKKREKYLAEYRANRDNIE